MKRENRYMVYIKICMLSFLLFSIVDSIFSKDSNKEGKELNNGLYQADSDSVVKEPVNELSAVAAGSCVDMFENKTVTSTMSVLGCDTLGMKNVTITSGGNLTVSASGNITMNGPFEVQSGGILNVNVGEFKLMFEFFYDLSGNRTMRQVELVKSDL